MPRVRKNRYGACIDVENAICVPSGDHSGFESGPSCVTTLRIAAIGDVNDRDVRGRAVGRIRVDAVVEGDGWPSGDQSKRRR